MNYSYCTEVRDTYEGEENALAEALALVEDNLMDLDNPTDRDGQCVVSRMTQVRVPFEGRLCVEHAVKVGDGFEAVMKRHGFAVSYRNSWIDDGYFHLAVQYEPVSNKESLDDQVMRLGNFIMSEVPGEPSLSQGACDTAIRTMSELQRISHAMWGILATVGEACDSNANLELIKAISESRFLYYVSGGFSPSDVTDGHPSNGLHRVTDRGVIPDVEPDRGSNAIAKAQDAKACELVSSTPTKADRIRDLGMSIAETVTKDSGIMTETIKEVVSIMCSRMEKLSVVDGDLVILRYDPESYVPSQEDVSTFADALQEKSGKNVQLVCLSVGFDLERLDAEEAVRLLRDRAGTISVGTQ